MQYLKFSFNSMKHREIFAKFGLTDLKISLNICRIRLTFVHAVQNGQNLSKLLLRPLLKFGGKVQKIFWTHAFSLGQILYQFIVFTNKIFHSAWILELPCNLWVINPASIRYVHYRFVHYFCLYNYCYFWYLKKVFL